MMEIAVAATIILRCILFLLAGAVLWIYGSSLVSLARGSQSLAQLGRADRAFYALSFLVGQIFWLVWPEPPVLVLALLLGATGLGLTIEVSRRARSKRLVQIDDLIDNPDLALPLLELADVDRPRALALAQEARASIAEARSTR